MTDQYLTFVAACVLLNLTPGSDTVYIVTRSVAWGRAAGLWSAAGIMTGCLVHTLLATLGLSAVLAASDLAFNALKLAGAAYLVWLGLRTLLRRAAPLGTQGPGGAAPPRLLFLQGLATNVLNPKVALFFLALLPQFVDPGRAGPAAFALLGLTFVGTGSLWCLVLVAASARLTRGLRERPRTAAALTRGSGLVYLALGGLVLWGERR